MTNITGTILWNVSYNVTLHKVNRSDTLWSLGCVLFVLAILAFGIWCSGMCRRRDDAYGNIHYNDMPQKNRLLDILKSKAQFLPMFKRLRKKTEDAKVESRLLTNSSGNCSSDSDYEDNVDVVYTRNNETSIQAL